MKKIALLVFSALSFYSCQKNYATFQKSSIENFDRKVKVQTNEKLSDKEFNNLISEVTKEAIITENNDAISKENVIEVVTSTVEPIKEASKGKEVGIVNLTPTSIKQMTGKKLSFSQTIALKKLQKKAEKQTNNKPNASGKSQLVALILAILVGVLGIHRFYLGYTTYGIIQLLTAGGCGIWALIDIIRIATGDLKPNGGNYDEEL